MSSARQTGPGGARRHDERRGGVSGTWGGVHVGQGRVITSPKATPWSGSYGSAVEKFRWRCRDDHRERASSTEVIAQGAGAGTDHGAVARRDRRGDRRCCRSGLRSPMPMGRPGRRAPRLRRRRRRSAARAGSTRGTRGSMRPARKARWADDWTSVGGGGSSRGDRARRPRRRPGPARPAGGRHRRDRRRLLTSARPSSGRGSSSSRSTRPRSMLRRSARGSAANATLVVDHFDLAAGNDAVTEFVAASPGTSRTAAAASRSEWAARRSRRDLETPEKTSGET